MNSVLDQPPEVLFPDEFCRPSFQMGPYDNAAMARNSEIARAAEGPPAIDWPGYFGPGRHFTLTLNGREALAFAVADLGLRRDDEILIVTTTEGPYVSSCVTDTISRYCRWSRQRSGRTRAVVLIHEFGFPARLPPDLAGAGLPIIEDCAYARGSQNREGTVAAIGDYVVWSFSKAFPMPYGGLLKSPGPVALRSALSPPASRQLPVLISHYLRELPAACRRRREFFEQYRERFAAVGLHPLFEPGVAAVPHGFIVGLPEQHVAETIKPLLHAAGVISSVFYGGGGYFLPNHQSLSGAAIDYIVANFVAALREARNTV